MSFKPTMRIWIQPKVEHIETPEMIEQIEQIDSMSETEKKLQCALGLLCDWIMVVEDLAMRRQHQQEAHGWIGIDYYKSDHSHQTYVVVKAINEAHAKRQIKQSGLFPESEYKICGGWQSDISGAYYREIFQHPYKEKFSYYEGKTFVLS